MSNLLKSKFLLGAMVVAVMFAGVAAVASTASADCTVVPTVKVGSTGASVSCVQTKVGATADGSFGPMTKAAVMAYQAANGLTADGVVGPMSAAKMNSVASSGSYPAGCTSSVGYSSTTGAKCDGGSSSSPTSMGSGEGDMTNFSEVASGDSTLKEGETNELFAFTAEVEGDVSVDRVDFFLDSTAAGAHSENADDYFQNASLLVDGKKVATVDVDDFSEDSYGEVSSVTGDTDEYRIRFSSLDLVLQDGDEPKFVLAFDANKSIDSTDLGETWGVELLTDSVRFVDGKDFSDTAGAALSETFTGASEDTAELDINSSTNDPDASTIEVSDSDDTQDVKVFVFDIEEQNDVDVTVDDVTVTITTGATTGTTDESAVVSDASLYKGSTLLGSESVPAGGVVSFENMNLDISGGDSEEITLKLTFADVDGYTEGTDVTAVLTSIDDATDANGNDEGDMTVTGEGLSSETHELRSEGISVKLVDTSAAPTGTTKTFIADAAGEDDQGTYEISFSVTAFGNDMYIDNSSEAGGANAAGQGVEFLERDSAGTPALSSNLLTSTTTDTADTANVFKVAEGETRTFTLTVIYTADTTPTDGSVEVYLESINWGTATNDTNANYYTFDLGDYKTGYLFLNAM